MELHVSLRPEETSFPIVFLEVFMPDSVDWPTHLRLKSLLQIEEYIKKMEGDLYKNRSHFESCNDEYECAKSQNECDESIDSDNLSSNCEDRDSSFSESDDCNQHE